jgi:hypothetical protein
MSVEMMMMIIIEVVGSLGLMGGAFAGSEIEKGRNCEVLKMVNAEYRGGLVGSGSREDRGDRGKLRMSSRRGDADWGAEVLGLRVMVLLVDMDDAGRDCLFNARMDGSAKLWEISFRWGFPGTWVGWRIRGR